MPKPFCAGLPLQQVVYSFFSFVRSGSGTTRNSVSGSLTYNSSHARCASISVLIACSVAWVQYATQTALWMTKNRLRRCIQPRV